MTLTEVANGKIESLERKKETSILIKFIHLIRYLIKINFCSANNPRYNEETPKRFKGFAGKHESDEEEEPPKPRAPRSGGAAIAPPPSLQEKQKSPPMSLGTPKSGGNRFEGGGSVAAKIMAKFGYKVKYLIKSDKNPKPTNLNFRKDKALVVRSKEFPPPFKWKRLASEEDELSTSLLVEALCSEALRLLLRQTSLLLLRHLHL